jgi:DNA-binding NtrC family response regulator
MNAEIKSSGALVLVVEDDPAIRNNVAELLSEEGYDVIVADNGRDGIALCQARAPDIIICDIMLPILDGHALLRAVRESPKTSGVPFIFLTARAERADVRAGMNLGADDYLTKPFALAELLEAVRTRILRVTELTRRAQVALERVAVSPVPQAGFDTKDGVVVVDPRMQQIYDEAALVAASSINVLILGETGVGKEILARALHNLSDRKDGPFVAINCAALTESLLESELFGNERGAFTGAAQARVGLFETANRGTIFLDEVGELPPTIQTKLLRVIEERRVMRVGGRTTQAINVRIVSATNRDLEAEVELGRFRQDLFYRLNTTSFTLPPLRERPCEIEPLIEVFLARACAERAMTETLAMTPECRAALRRYPWPGNLRELRNVVERAVVLCRNGTLELRHLPEKVVHYVAPSRTSTPATQRPPMTSGDRRSQLRRELEDIERERIQQALEQTGGNQSMAAELLQISRRTLVYKLTALGMTRPRKTSGIP